MVGDDMCGRGACVAGSHAWWGACVAGACMVGGVHGRGHVWQGACVAGGHEWQGACMAGGGMRGRYYEIRSMSGRYASYWNAFLLTLLSYFNIQT